MQATEWLSIVFTRIYARLIDRGGVTNEEFYQAHGEKKRVFWVNGKNWPMAGQYTLFGTILLNETKLDNVSENIVDYVFLHEIGHSKAPTLLGVTSVLLRVPLLLFAVIGIPVLIGQWLIFLFSIPGLNSLMIKSLAYFILVLILVGPLVIIWRLDEGHAEFWVISKVGEDIYRNFHEEIKENRNKGYIMKIFHKVFYPKPNQIIWFKHIMK